MVSGHLRVEDVADAQFCEDDPPWLRESSHLSSPKSEVEPRVDNEPEVVVWAQVGSKVWHLTQVGKSPIWKDANELEGLLPLLISLKSPIIAENRHGEVVFSICYLSYIFKLWLNKTWFKHFLQ